jgi:hypothetical protein
LRRRVCRPAAASPKQAEPRHLRAQDIVEARLWRASELLVIDHCNGERRARRGIGQSIGFDDDTLGRSFLRLRRAAEQRGDCRGGDEPNVPGLAHRSCR